MARRRQSKRFWLVAVVAYGLAATVIALGAGSFKAYGADRGVALGNLAADNRIDPLRAYQAAHLLSPDNLTITDGLAKAYIANGQANEAILSLSKAPTDAEGSIILSRAYLERNKPQMALDVPLTPGSQAMLQHAMAVIVSGGELPDNSADGLSSTDKESLQRIATGGIPLARELRLHGMPATAAQILNAAPDSVTKYQMLAALALEKPNRTAADIAGAVSNLEKAVSLQPSSVEARQALQQAYDIAGMKAKAAVQQSAIAKLQSGRFK